MGTRIAEVADGITAGRSATGMGAARSARWNSLSGGLRPSCLRISTGAGRAGDPAVLVEAVNSEGMTIPVWTALPLDAALGGEDLSARETSVLSA